MEANIGIALGTVLAIVVWLGPIVLVKKLNIKVRKPKAKFVEPAQWKIGIFFMLGTIVTAPIALVIGGMVQLTGIEILTNNEGVVGSMLTMFAISSALLIPVTVYMLNAHVRYKRIVQYKSEEWEKINR